MMRFAWIFWCAAAFAQPIPTLDYSYPTGNTVPINTKLLAHVACCTRGTPSLILRIGTQGVAGRLDYSYSNRGQWVLFTPAQALSARTTYTADVSMPGAASASFSFTTGTDRDTAPPTIVSTYPSAGQDAAAVPLVMSLKFSKPMNPLSFEGAGPSVTEVTSSYSSVSGWTLTEASTLTSTSTYPMQLGAVFRVTPGAGRPQDLSGNALVNPLSEFTFTTYPEAPKDGPRMQASVPAEGETGVATNSALFLLFDRPVVLPADAVFTLSSDGDPRVSLKAEAIRGTNALVLRLQALLRGNQDYTLRAEPFLDAFGGRFAGGVLLRFRTGTLPESRSFQQLNRQPATVPNVKQLQWRFNRAVNPYLLPWLVRQGALPDEPAIEMRASSDGMTITADIPGPGRYFIGGSVYDRLTSIQQYGLGDPIVVSDVPDNKAPAVVTLFPPDGATGVGANVNPTVLFDEQVDQFQASDAALWRGDERIAINLSTAGPLLSFLPRAALPAGDYRMEVRNAHDAAGNVTPDLIWTFRVEPIPVTEPFRVVRVEPADRTVNVDVGTPLSIEFTRPPNLIQLVSPFSNAAVFSQNRAVPGRWRTEGNTAFFQPESVFPTNARVSWSVFGATDFAGARITGTANGGFWTTGADPTPTEGLKIVSTSATLNSGTYQVALNFNQQVNPSTVSSQTILLSIRESPQGTSVSYDAAARRAWITFSNPYLSGTNNTARVVAAGIQGIDGTFLEPFSEEILLPSPSNNYSVPQVREVGPFLSGRTLQYEGVAPGHPIVVYFLKPMQRDLVERALSFYVGSSKLAGRIEWAPDNTALTFISAVPLRAGINGALVLSKVPWGGAGVESKSFTTGSPDLAGPQPPAVKLSIFYPWGYMPTDAIIDLEFDRDRPPDYVRSALAGNFNAGGITSPLEITVLSARRVRLRPSKPFPPSTTLELKVTTADGEVRQFLRIAPWATPTSRQIAHGPTGPMGDAPLNAVVWLHSQTPLNPLPFRAQMNLNGEPVAFDTELLDGGFRVVLRPKGLLRGYSTYNVAITGLEDVAGRPLADRSWTFHTGAGPDLVPAKLISSAPTGIAPASAILQATFDKPVYVVRYSYQSYEVPAQDFVASTQAGDVPGAVSYSLDGRTLSFIPDRPWPLNSTVTVSIDRFHYSDWTGQSITEVRESTGNNLVGPAFTTAATRGDAAATVDLRNPSRDAVETPLNVQIQAHFAEPVLHTSLDLVRLENESGRVKATARLEADGQTVTILPEKLLEMNRIYTVTAEGVKNGNGVAQAAAEQWSFRTGNSIAGNSVTAVGAALPGDPLTIRVEVPRPVNPISVRPEAFGFNFRGLNTAVSVRADADGRALFVKPAVQAIAGSNCNLSSRSLRDWAGLPITLSVDCLGAAAPPDQDAPRVTLQYPTPGATMSWSNSAALVMNEPFWLRNGNAGIRLRWKEREIAASVSITATTIRLRPQSDWIPGETYEVEVQGLTDASGNEAATVRWSFRIAEDGASDATFVRLLSATPPTQAVGVPVDTTIAFQFSRPVTPSEIPYQPTGITASRAGAIFNLLNLYQEVFDESRMRYVGGALPAGARITASYRVQDMAGGNASGSTDFLTAAASDSTPPQLESISPPPGTALPAGQAEFVLRFNEPVSPVGDWIRYSAAGNRIPASITRFPVQGDARIVLVTFSLPDNPAGTLDLLPGLVDLSGNPIANASFEYGAIAPGRPAYLRLLSVKPAAGREDLPVNAPIELRFNQPVDMASLIVAVTVWNDGAVVPVTITEGSEPGVYIISPAAPWREGSFVTMNIAANLYSASGVFWGFPTSLTWRVPSGTVNNMASNALAAVDATPEAIDLRFAEPRTRLPEEPFGIRLGQERVPVRAERMGETWFRLTPDRPLDPAQSYMLMAGPDIELPLRFKAVPAAVEDSTVETEAGGSLRVRLGRGMHPFALNRQNLVVLDGDGNPLPYSATLSENGTLQIEVYGSRVPSRVRISERVLTVGGAGAKPRQR